MREDIRTQQGILSRGGSLKTPAQALWMICPFLLGDYMANKYAEAKRNRYTSDYDIAFKVYNTAVQCGECYQFYNPADPKNNSVCPCCGADEWVGSR